MVREGSSPLHLVLESEMVVALGVCWKMLPGHT